MLVSEVVEMTERQAARDPFSNELEARICELVMGDRRHGI